MKRRSKKKMALAALVAATTIGAGAIGADKVMTDIKNENKVKKVYDILIDYQVKGHDKIFMNTNEFAEVAMAMPSYKEKGSSVEIVYFTEAGNYMRLIDDESNGFGGVDRIRISDIGPVEVKNPSKKLKKFANKYYHASLDHTIAYHDEGETDFKGPPMEDLYTDVKYEFLHNK